MLLHGVSTRSNHPARITHTATGGYLPCAHVTSTSSQALPLSCHAHLTLVSPCFTPQACKLLDKVGRKVLKLLSLSLEANQYTLHQLLDNVPHANYQSSSRLECLQSNRIFALPNGMRYGSVPRRQEAGLLDVVAGDQPEVKVRCMHAWRRLLLTLPLPPPRRNTPSGNCLFIPLLHATYMTCIELAALLLELYPSQGSAHLKHPQHAWLQQLLVTAGPGAAPAQVYSADGKWESIKLRHNQVVVLAGATLEYATGGQYSFSTYTMVSSWEQYSAAARLAAVLAGQLVLAHTLESLPYV